MFIFIQIEHNLSILVGFYKNVGDITWSVSDCEELVGVTWSVSVTVRN